MHPWILVQVLRGREKQVCESLIEVGYDAFCPFFEQTRYTTRNRSRIVVRPLFPPYIFCRRTAKAQGKVIDVPGVFAFAGTKAGHRIVDDRTVEALKYFDENRAFVGSEPIQTVLQRHLKGENEFKSGDRVFLTIGPLSGLSAIVSNIIGTQVVVNVTLLQRQVAVRVSLDWISREETVQRPQRPQTAV